VQISSSNNEECAFKKCDFFLCVCVCVYVSITTSALGTKLQQGPIENKKKKLRKTALSDV